LDGALCEASESFRVFGWPTSVSLAVFQILHASADVLGSSSKLPVQSVFALHWLSLAASVHLIDDKVIKLLQLLTLKFIILRQVFRGGVWSQLSCTVFDQLISR
jgi:hypothetical protein